MHKIKNKKSKPTMTPEDSQRLESCLQEVAEILYRQTSTTELKNFESIEKTVRKQMLEQVSPKIAFFYQKGYWN
jgi:hypothetical protein